MGFHPPGSFSGVLIRVGVPFLAGCTIGFGLNRGWMYDF